MYLQIHNLFIIKKFNEILIRLSIMKIVYLRRCNTNKLYDESYAKIK